MMAHRIPVDVPSTTHTRVRLIDCKVQVLDFLAETRERWSYVRLFPLLEPFTRIPDTSNNTYEYQYDK